jgi:hypothetical protein
MAFSRDLSRLEVEAIQLTLNIIYHPALPLDEALKMMEKM